MKTAVCGLASDAPIHTGDVLSSPGLGSLDTGAGYCFLGHGWAKEEGRVVNQLAQTAEPSQFERRPLDDIVRRLGEFEFPGDRCRLEEEVVPCQEWIGDDRPVPGTCEQARVHPSNL